MSWGIAIYDLDFIDKKLRRLLADKERVFGPGVITSLYRIGDDGAHGTLPLRAADERCQYKPQGDMIAEYLNDWWIYDSERPDMKVCMCHDTGQGLHMHFQVHPNTIKRGGS